MIDTAFVYMHADMTKIFNLFFEENTLTHKDSILHHDMFVKNITIYE